MAPLDPVLVIGGCGGLGYNIVRQLQDSGDATDITILDIDCARNRIDEARYVEGSIASKDNVSAVLNLVEPKVIFHVASPHMMQQNATPQLFEEINVHGTRNLLHCIHENGSPKVLVYTSSTGVVHDGFSDMINITEDAPLCLFLKQPEFYHQTKALAEKMVLAENRKNGLLTVALRPCTLYGEGDNTTLPQMVGNAQAGRGFMQVGDGKNMFDFLYLGNAAYAHILAAKRLLHIEATAPPPAIGKRIDGEAFFLSNGSPMPFWEFVRAVGAAAGHPVKPEQIRRVPTSVYYVFAVLAEWTMWLLTFGRRKSHINRKMVRFFTMTTTFDITKARERLGYEPPYTTQEGIQRGVDAFLLATEKKKKV